MTAPVLWHFDVISPYAWLALHRLPEIEALRPVTVKPVVFGAILKHWGQLGPAEIGPKRLHTYRQVAFLAAEMGIAFRFPARHPFRSLDMLRLIVALGSTPDATRAAFSAIWAKGADATDPAVLMAVATECGDPAAVERISDPAVKDQLTANSAQAIEKGVFGVPTLTIDGESFWGLDSMDMALAFLRDPGILLRGEVGRAAHLDVGVERPR